MTSSTSIDYTFTFRAIEPGKVTVPPVTITANGKQMKSQEITFTIFPMDSDTPQQGSSANQRPQVHVDDIHTQTPGPVSPQDLFVHISLSRDRVYEQEPIIASIKVYTKFRISSFLANTQPSFDGFMNEELPVNNELTPDHFNGQNYYSAELKKVINASASTSSEPTPTNTCSGFTWQYSASASTRIDDFGSGYSRRQSVLNASSAFATPGAGGYGFSFVFSFTILGLFGWSPGV